MASAAMRKFIIMGVQGCGKGTQAKMLAQDFDLFHISVGDVFRWHIQSRTKLAARIRRLVTSGELVPDEIVEEVVKERLEIEPRVPGRNAQNAQRERGETSPRSNRIRTCRDRPGQGQDRVRRRRQGTRGQPPGHRRSARRAPASAGRRWLQPDRRDRLRLRARRQDGRRDVPEHPVRDRR